MLYGNAVEMAVHYLFMIIVLISLGLTLIIYFTQGKIEFLKQFSWLWIIIFLTLIPRLLDLEISSDVSMVISIVLARIWFETLAKLMARTLQIPIPKYKRTTSLILAVALSGYFAYVLELDNLYASLPLLIYSIAPSIPILHRGLLLRSFNWLDGTIFVIASLIALYMLYSPLMSKIALVIFPPTLMEIIPGLLVLMCLTTFMAIILPFRAQEWLHTEFRKRQEQELLEKSDELSQLYNAMVEKSKAQATGFLAAGVAHEVKNPLSVIQLSANLLQYQIHSGDNNSFQRELKLIRDNVMNASKMARGLLRLSKSEDNSGPQENVNLREVVEDVVKLNSARFSQKQVKVEVIAATEIWATGSQTQIGQILLNLIKNSIHAVSEIDSPEILIEISSSDHEAFVRVQDNGNGISADSRKQIFNPFFTTKSVEEGTGLGLSISKSLAQKMGGDLILEEAKNTTLRLQLRKYCGGGDKSGKDIISG